MKYRFENLQMFISDELLKAYEKRDKETILFNDLLNSVIRKYNLSLLSSCFGYEVRGENAYNIITDLLYALKLMCNEGIILYYSQGEPLKSLEGMDFCDPVNYSSGVKITKEFADYLTDSLGMSIWISPQIRNYSRNGYVPEAIALARKQTKWAYLTFIITFVALMITFAVDILRNPLVLTGLISILSK